MKEELKREEVEQEYYDDLKAEANKREIVVELKVRLVVESHEAQLAAEKALDMFDDNLIDYVVGIKAEDYKWGE